MDSSSVKLEIESHVRAIHYCRRLLELLLPRSPGGHLVGTRRHALDRVAPLRVRLREVTRRNCDDVTDHARVQIAKNRPVTGRLESVRDRGALRDVPEVELVVIGR